MGFITPPNRSQPGSVIARACPFTTSAATFLRVVVVRIRNGRSYTSLHFEMNSQWRNDLEGSLLRRAQYI
jgi:hypothetical protein